MCNFFLIHIHFSFRLCAKVNIRTLCLKNAPTLASCSFDNHELILVTGISILLKMICVQLSLSLHFYLLYLLSSSCDGNDAF